MQFRQIIIMLLILLSATASSQYSSENKKAIKSYEKAQEQFRARNDAEAEELLCKALKADDQFIEAWFMLAQISLDKGNGAEAAAHFIKGLEVDPSRNPDGYLKVAEVEFAYGEYYKSFEHVKLWESFGIIDRMSVIRASVLKKNAEFAINAVENPVPFNPESMGDSINSPLSEYWPSLSIDEKTLFFTVKGPMNPNLPPESATEQEDFYFAIKEGDTWRKRACLGPPVNTNKNEGAQSITADGNFIYFTACNRSDGHGRMCDLYYSEIKDGVWSKPVNLGHKVNTKYSEKHPAISADGRTLFFTSNRPGGLGDYDIWVSHKQDGIWGTPVNMGDSINSRGIEQSPFIHPDQQSLYFSSDGWTGMGQGDLFISRRKPDKSWSKPENLGYPINTHNEEIGMIVNAMGDRAYFSSNRREGTDIDIYTFELPLEIRPIPVSYMTGRVYDSRNMKGILAMFQLIDIESGDLVMEANSNEGEGDYLISLPTQSAYAFNVSQPGYLFYSDHFELTEEYSNLDPFVKNIPLEPIKTGKLVVLNNVFFDTDSYTLKKQSTVELDKILEFLLLNANVRVEISGHTDNTGTTAHNIELSKNRAGEVVKYIEEKGIDPDRLESKGYGASQAIDTNDTEEGKAKNRRTELKIIGVK
jgi:outer membrane protein OmpA-like peptidoglycan-associated protein